MAARDFTLEAKPLSSRSPQYCMDDPSRTDCPVFKRADRTTITPTTSTIVAVNTGTVQTLYNGIGIASVSIEHNYGNTTSTGGGIFDGDSGMNYVVAAIPQDSSNTLGGFFDPNGALTKTAHVLLGLALALAALSFLAILGMLLRALHRRRRQRLERQKLVEEAAVRGNGPQVTERVVPVSAA